MVIDMANVRVMNTTDENITLILSTNVLEKNAGYFREVRTRTMQDGKEIVVEVGLPGSGQRITLLAKMLCFRG